ncbi:MAG: tetratricopeptide repeat protein [Bacteroidaceae bacterium]|nr:tetratricopeptide repeat protein [Bacteroidaceae bacterium]
MIRHIKTILAFSLITVFAGVNAQDQLKTLIITNITPELSVYPCGDRHEAQVILRCQEPFDLVLSSNVDAKLDLSITTEGPEKVYSIIFKTREEGTSFKGRQLTVVAEGFKKHYIPLNLNDKEKFEFMVSDPYSKLRSLYYTSTEEGLNYMTDGLYDAAIDKFNIAKQCPEFAETENHLDKYIQLCDSLKEWTNLATSYMDKEDYFNARALYLKMMTENPSCSLIRDLYYNANENFTRVSRHDIEVAQAYFDSKRYDEARDLYEHAIAQNNPQSSLAGTNLAFIQLKRYKQDNHTRSMSYIYEPDCNIGIMFAGLKPDKSGAYFSLGLQKGMFDLASGNLEPVTSEDALPEKPTYQGMLSLGWTLRIYTRNKNQFVPKVWMLMTPFSYAAGGYYTKFNNPDYNPNSSDNDNEYIEKYHLIHAVAPEVGLAVRVWRLVLSYRYQYRYILNIDQPVSDDLVRPRNLLGVGFCW